jgi:hypothetical protein
MTPFWANYHYHPVMQFEAPKQPSHLNSEIQADTFAAGVQETHQTLRKNLQETQANQKKYASGKEVDFEVRDKICLSVRHIRTTRLSKKLDYKRTAPYTVSKVINKIADKLKLPYKIWKRNVSMSLCSTAIHLFPLASHHLNGSQQLSTTLMNGQATGSSSVSDATRSSIITYSGWVTVTYGLAGNLWRISGMCRNQSTSFTECI